ncbi:hypothetical protein [Thioalkalivibrio sp. ALMg11]|uniref:hypothetical protein n=1 Tax=Thioalkalivibrio sp. ALMg11 TaxID=1158165 RepID=UPI00036DABB0|nr:hypothetical protein [Thioalkalivibrio sp. ALMg11]
MNQKHKRGPGVAALIAALTVGFSGLLHAGTELESHGEGEWMELSFEEHLMKATIQGASRGPAGDDMQRMFERTTGSSEPVEIRAERQNMIEGQPGCAVVFMYFVQEGVPVVDRDGNPAGTKPFEIRYHVERCADGDIPEYRSAR